MENTSGSGDSAAVPPELQRWNWAAFLGGFLWALENRMPREILLVSCIPFYGPFACGKRGYEWTWKHQGWINLDHLLQNQKKQRNYFLAVYGLTLLSVPLLFLLDFLL